MDLRFGFAMSLAKVFALSLAATECRTRQFEPFSSARLLGHAVSERYFHSEQALHRQGTAVY
jgi:hypothetical protein